MEKSAEKQLNLFWYTIIWSVFLMLAVPFAYLYVKEDIFYDFFLILTSPSKLITDYFSLGGLGATFLNAGLCGLFCNLMMKVFKVNVTASVLAGYFLVIAHCFYGLNLLNMMPPFFGVMLFCFITKRNFKDYIYIAMLSTAIGPFISDFIFRYTLSSEFVLGVPQVSVLGILLALVFSVIAGFSIPALIPETAKMYRGYNLFKAGLAIGLFGMVAYAFFYKTLGVELPDVVYRQNSTYINNGSSYLLFVNLFFIAIFLLTFIIGFIGNGKSFSGYSSLIKCDGWQDDFYAKFGASKTYINIAIYGLFILGFLNVVFLVAKGAGFTGPTAGIVIAAITFSACGQTVKNVWPIALGFVILISFVALISSLVNLPISWVNYSQVYINGFAFATGLCPFAGRYGWKIGTVSGIICSILCMITASMHGGFVLYNSGFTAGLTAMILVSILDFYKIKPKYNDNEKK